MSSITLLYSIPYYRRNQYGKKQLLLISLTSYKFMNLLSRNNVVIRGTGERVMMFAHGFGCDQNMWRYVWPAFEDQYKIVLFDHVGAGNSDLSAYSVKKYEVLEGYVDDIIEILHE